MRAWTIQEAQDRLGEVIEEAIQQGPQIISRQGTEIAVVLSYEEYLALKGTRTNLSQFLPGVAVAGLGPRPEKRSL